MQTRKNVEQFQTRRENYLESPLPSNEDAERAVLGFVLIDERLMSIVADEISASDFYSPINRRIFAAMTELFAGNKPIDPINILEELKKEGPVESIGGLSTIGNLSFGLPMISVREGDRVLGYCKLIRDKSRVRDLIRTCNAIVSSAAGDDEDSEVVISQAQTAINNVCAKGERREFTSLGELSTESVRKIEALRSGTVTAAGLQCGLRAVDIATGGFQPSDLVIIAGRPGMGKSSFAAQIAIGGCKADPKAVIAIFSLEMSKEQYTNRLLSSIAGVDLTKMRTGNVNEMELVRLADARDWFKTLNIEIDDSGSVTTAQIRAKVLKLQHERGRIDAVIVDFLQRMVTLKKTNGRTDEVGTVARELKSLAKDLNVPVIALSSLSRACETRQPPVPRMSDLRESGDIESEADLVAFLYRPHYYDQQAPSSIADFIIDKHRHGPTQRIPLTFSREYTQFGDA
jgi:replicative DNA helicase